ncbi:hypothetical protein Pint_31394 [Pistacia integerrima]|uniref:Uncharacterized protein n=1 Tax=Pistacia integerrima TaxID=434235 RepID=A0ACC0XN13_9ROSI|nr:hypothetical protein Pint_31394 [Pistacia integerrima]
MCIICSQAQLLLFLLWLLVLEIVLALARLPANLVFLLTSGEDGDKTPLGYVVLKIRPRDYLSTTKCCESVGRSRDRRIAHVSYLEECSSVTIKLPFLLLIGGKDGDKLVETNSGWLGCLKITCEGGSAKKVLKYKVLVKRSAICLSFSIQRNTIPGSLCIIISCHVYFLVGQGGLEARVVFKTRIFHCNVDSAGDVSLDILKDSWSPALTITKVLLAIRSMFTNPDPYNPVVPGIAHLYLAERAKHDQLAAEWTHRFAK